MNTRRSWVVLLLLCLLPAWLPVAAADDNWLLYKQRFIKPDGRVVDTGNAGISHSEGQGSAMLLAVAHDDRETFGRVWDWTRRHLALREDGLFVWKWDPAQANPAEDQSSATDGDLLITWALARAGQRWQQTKYSDIARGLARSIRARLLLAFGGDTLILPGPQWPVRPGAVILNLSYWIFPALQELAVLDPDPLWERSLQSGLALLARARYGTWDLPADWVALQEDGRLIQADAYPFVFGYEAVRIPLYYLWGGYAQKERLRVYQAFWAASAKGNQLVTTLGLSSNRVLQQESVLAFRAVHALVGCALTGKASTVLSSRLSEHDDYYSSTLYLFVQQAAAERLPHCRADSVAAAGACREGAEGQRCPLSDPVPGRVRTGDAVVRLADVAQLPSSQARRPLARIAALATAGSEGLLVAEMDGRVYQLAKGRLLDTPLLDLATVRKPQFLSHTARSGLVALAVGSGKAGNFLYTAHSERPGERGAAAAPLLGNPATAEHVQVLMEWRLDGRGPFMLRPGGGREVLRLAVPEATGGIRSLAVDGDAGELFIGVADSGQDEGTPATVSAAQDPASPHGKILRVRPQAGRTAPGYALPPGKPLFTGGGALPEIWALGVREPRGLVVSGGSLWFGDAGGPVQEFNRGQAGANYGWPLRSGSFAHDLASPGQLFALPASEPQAGALIYPAAQYDADEGSAICGGLPYQGKAVPVLTGRWVLCDAQRGRLFLAPTSGLEQSGRVAALEELRLLHHGLERDLLMLLGGDARADLLLGRDGHGELYVASGRDGVIRRLEADPLAATVPAMKPR